MKALMKTGLLSLYPFDVDDEVIELLERIDGQIVELTFTGSDAFEKVNDNIWLPHELWERIDGNKH